MTKYILYETSIGGWYAGISEKYGDVFNLCASKNGAEKLEKEYAIKRMNSLNKRGYLY